MIHPEWLNQNEHRAYPFREDASLLDTSGTVVVPNGLVLDCIVTLEADADFMLYMTTLTKAAGFYALALSDVDGVTVATVSVNAVSHTYGQSHALTGVGAYELCRGRIAFGRLDSFDVDMPDGVYAFEGAVLEACTVRPDLRAVRSIRVADGFGESPLLYGHVRLVEGRNVRLTSLPSQNAIQIDAIPGEGYVEECDCENDDTGGVIRTINGISARSMQIEAGPGVQITRSGDTLRIASPGVQPCCSCTELETVTAALDNLRDDSRTLFSYAGNVESILAAVKQRLSGRL